MGGREKFEIIVRIGSMENRNAEFFKIRGYLINYGEAKCYKFIKDPQFEMLKSYPIKKYRLT